MSSTFEAMIRALSLTPFEILHVIKSFFAAFLSSEIPHLSTILTGFAKGTRHGGDRAPLLSDSTNCRGGPARFCANVATGGALAKPCLQGFAAHHTNNKKLRQFELA